MTPQLKSVIRRTKETPNVHPMYRDGLLRRKVGPVIVNKSNSQDRLIEELQGKLGIGRAERRRKQQDDWLTEGVIVMSKPQRLRSDGACTEVEKVGAMHFRIKMRISQHSFRIRISFRTFPFCLFYFLFPSFTQMIMAQQSSLAQRLVLPPSSPPAPRRTPTAEEPKKLPPVRHPPVPTPPPLPPAPFPPPQFSFVHEPMHRSMPPRHTVKPLSAPVLQPPASKPQPLPCLVNAPTMPPHVEPAPLVVPKVLVSVGCQTECHPIFPPMQAWSSVSFILHCFSHT